MYDSRHLQRRRRLFAHRQAAYRRLSLSPRGPSSRHPLARRRPRRPLVCAPRSQRPCRSRPSTALPRDGRWHKPLGSAAAGARSQGRAASSALQSGCDRGRAMLCRPALVRTVCNGPFSVSVGCRLMGGWVDEKGILRRRRRSSQPSHRPSPRDAGRLLLKLLYFQPPGITAPRPRSSGPCLSLCRRPRQRAPRRRRRPPQHRPRAQRRRRPLLPLGRKSNVG